MFSQVKMVRKHIEREYQDTCSVIEHKPVTQEDGSTEFEDVTVYENIPCRLSYKNAATTGETASASTLNQLIEVFISPDIEIKSGSKLVINHLGHSTEYKSSGVPSMYRTHQEIILELFKGWS